MQSRTVWRGASRAALVLALAASGGLPGGGLVSAPAWAFEQVDWAWSLTAATDVDTDVAVTPELTPSGAVALEALQLAIGDPNAVSQIEGVTVAWPEGRPALDAEVDLGYVAAAATTVANNLDVGSDVPVAFTVGQFALAKAPFARQISAPGGGEAAAVAAAGEAVGESDNLNQDLALLLLSGVLAGVVAQGDLDSLATVADIEGAAAASEATTVANTVALSVTPAGPNDGVVQGDLTQFSPNDVTATSGIARVAVGNQVNMGLSGRPLAASTATAVGNNASLAVGN